jgi:pimeloyl-[acyl-carrier protein] methyl ester esterase
MKIYKKIEGQGSDIVLIHGWGCDHRHMQPISDLLKSLYKVTNIDLPGRGGSEWDSKIRNVNDIADLVIPHLPETAIYIPWSFGGLVTLSIAARHPERVNKIVGIATTPRFVEDKSWKGVPKPGFKTGFDQVRNCGFHAFFKEFYKAEFSAVDCKSAGYIQLIKLLNETPEQDLDVLLSGVNICDIADFRDEFSKLKCPIDLILGDKDASVSLENHMQLKQLNPDADIHVMPEAQHMPFWTHQGIFNERLKSILNKDE